MEDFWVACFEGIMIANARRPDYVYAARPDFLEWLNALRLLDAFGSPSVVLYYI